MRKLLYFLSALLGIFLLLSLIGISRIWDGYTDRFSRNFWYDSEQRAIFGGINLADVPPYVELYEADKSFVLARQKPHYYNDPMYDYNEGYEYKNGLHENYFWVINLTTDCVYGPLTYDEFRMRCREEKVSSSLYEKFMKQNDEGR